MAGKSPNLGSKPCSMTPGGFLTGAVKLWFYCRRDPMHPNATSQVGAPYWLQCGPVSSLQTLQTPKQWWYSSCQPCSGICLYLFLVLKSHMGTAFSQYPMVFSHRCRGRRRGVPLWIEFNCLISPVLRRAMAASIGWMLLGGSWRLMETYGDI